MPLFRRTPKPVAPPSTDLPAGEEVERAVKARLLYGKDQIKGMLHMTNRRLLFEAEKAHKDEARWMVVPYTDVTEAGLYPWPGATMGLPSSLRQCLVVTTAQGEQVWWDFDERAEREWLPLVQAKIPATDSEES